jgi:hypothetical protein
MQAIGEVKLADDQGFEELKTLCMVHEGWKLVYNKGGTIVWTKCTDVTDFNMVKIQGVYADVTAETLYDVLHDPNYRKSWDPQIIDGYDICRIGPNSDVGYYSMKFVKPLMNRDFVTQRSWVDLGAEKLIFNHSVNHASVPPFKNFIRGISYITGYHIVATNGNPELPGCQLTYVTQADPKGQLPVWAVNMATTFVAPKVMGRLLKACQGYPEWKSQHRPEYKPWRYPEQSTLPLLNPSDIGSMQETTSALLIDERAVRRQQREENEASGDELAVC